MQNVKDIKCEKISALFKVKTINESKYDKQHQTTELPWTNTLINPLR